MLKRFAFTSHVVVFVIFLSVCPRSLVHAGPPSPPPRTGQTGCWDGAGGSIACANTGQDGDLRKGVAWPNPRFTDNWDNTVTDNLTGLMWRKNANAGGNCTEDLGGYSNLYYCVTWNEALASAKACNNAAYAGYTDWRIPTVNELRSLISDQYANPALPNTAGTGQWSEGNPFNKVRSERYWTSTGLEAKPEWVWRVEFAYGQTDSYYKSNTLFVWPVRGGQ
jgi:hypothetical protein